MFLSNSVVSVSIIGDTMTMSCSLGLVCYISSNLFCGGRVIAFKPSHNYSFSYYFLRFNLNTITSFSSLLFPIPPMVLEVLVFSNSLFLLFMFETVIE